MNNHPHKAIRERFRKNEALCESMTGVFALLSNKIRFRIICTLRAGKLSVNEIVDIIGCGKQSNVSQQLKLLTASGIVSRTRDRKQQIYHLKDPRMSDLVGYLEKKYL